MSVKDNKAIVRRWVDEGWNKGNIDAIADEFFAPDFIGHDFTGSDTRGVESVKQRIAIIRAVFPDFHITIEDMIAEGDMVVTRWTSRGTHKGMFMGIPPTNKHVTWTGIDINRFIGGKTVEAWSNGDTLGLMQQLGAISSIG